MSELENIIESDHKERVAGSSTSMEDMRRGDAALNSADCKCINEHYA